MQRHILDAALPLTAAGGAMRGDLRKFAIGDRLSGTGWVVQTNLGERRTGAVYGVVKEPGVQGAMRVLPPAAARVPELVGRFLDEARLLAGLKHPNIVRIIDFDRFADGTPFTVMERLQGRTLRSALRAMRDSGGLTTSLAYEIVRQLCDGLICAHSHDPRIVHGDIRPDNVFVHVASGNKVLIKLIDFKLVDLGSDAIPDASENRLLLGTPHYVAPELLLGEAASPQSDIYSVALLLYQMLTDRFPWDVDVHTGAAAPHARSKSDPVPLSHYASWIPAAVDECIMQSLAKDPNARPASVGEFCASLCVLQFVDDGVKSAIDVDATPAARNRDLAGLAALAGIRNDSRRVSSTWNGTRGLRGVSMPPRNRRRAIVTGMVLATSVLACAVAAVVLAWPRTTISPAAASTAMAESGRAQPGALGNATDLTQAPQTPSANPFKMTFGDAAPARAIGRAPARSEPKSAPPSDEAFAPETPLAPAPSDNDDIPFLPEQP